MLVLEKLFPFIFNFDDFIFLYTRIANDDVRKKWRYKMLDKAKKSYSCKAEDFCFQLADHEQKYKTMFEYIRRCSYENILRYFQQIVATDKNMFLAVLLTKTDDRLFYSNDSSVNSDKEVFPKLFALMVSTYSQEHLRTAIQKEEKDHHWKFYNARFVTYMKQQLKMKQ